MKRGTAIALAALIGLSGCSSIGAGTPKGGAGSAIAAALINGLGDGVIGKDVGARLGAADRLRALEAEYRALEYANPGDPVAWTGKKNGQGGEAAAGQPYQVGSQNCRQLAHKVRIAGVEEVRRGAACRNADGSWTPLG